MRVPVDWKDAVYSALLVGFSAIMWNTPLIVQALTDTIVPAGIVMGACLLVWAFGITWCAWRLVERPRLSPVTPKE